MIPHRTQTLLLNADFRPLRLFPLSVLDWREAVQSVVAGKVTVVAEHAALVRSPSVTMRVPSVIALRRFRKRDGRVAFTRFNVFLRDGFRCQYCGKPFAADDLTFDHVVPRCGGGATDWDNVVSACGPCNTAKGSRNDVRPLRKPATPRLRDLVAARQCLPRGYLHETWHDYLYWDSELET